MSWTSSSTSTTAPRPNFPLEPSSLSSSARRRSMNEPIDDAFHQRSTRRRIIATQQGGGDYEQDDDDDDFCRFTREQLQHKLKLSEFGKDVVTFGSYFCPGNDPVRCIFCDRTINEHQSEAAIPVSTSFVDVPEELEMFKRGQTVDVLDRSSGKAFAYVAAILYFGCVATLIGFLLSGIIGTTGVAELAPVTVPVVFFAAATFFSLLPERTRVEFDKRHRMIRVSQLRLIWFCCCGDAGECSFEDVIGVVNTTTGHEGMLSSCCCCCSSWLCCRNCCGVPQRDISMTFRVASPTTTRGGGGGVRNAAVVMDTRRDHVVLNTVEHATAGREEQWWRNYFQELGITLS